MQTAQCAQKNTPTSESICPYQPLKNSLCSASVMPVRIDNQKRSLCCDTEDFDQCPIFLAKVLRGR
jgi:hypothetical protein